MTGRGPERANASSTSDETIDTTTLSDALTRLHVFLPVQDKIR